MYFSWYTHLDIHRIQLPALSLQASKQGGQIGVGVNYAIPGCGAPLIAVFILVDNEEGFRHFWPLAFPVVLAQT